MFMGNLGGLWPVEPWLAKFSGSGNINPTAGISPASVRESAAAVRSMNSLHRCTASPCDDREPMNPSHSCRRIFRTRGVATPSAAADAFLQVLWATRAPLRRGDGDRSNFPLSHLAREDWQGVSRKAMPLQPQLLSLVPSSANHQTVVATKPSFCLGVMLLCQYC